MLWYSAQYRDWDVTNGSIAQEVSLVPCSVLSECAPLVSSQAIGALELILRLRRGHKKADRTASSSWRECRTTSCCLGVEADGRAGPSMCRMNGA